MDFSAVLRTVFLLVVCVTISESDISKQPDVDAVNDHGYWRGADVTNVLKIFAPVSPKVQNELCRKQSVLYIRELHKFTLWATQMFDASTKFPNGILVGSTYDLGNFDECLQVDVNTPTTDRLQGQYCLAKIKFENDKYKKVQTDNKWSLNISTWDRIQLLSEDPSKRSRNEVHWAFCIPASCGPDDLKIQLQEVLQQYQPLYNFKASVIVEEHMCQTYQQLQLSIGDIIMLVTVGIFGLMLGVSTSYDLLTSMDGFRHIKLPNTWHRVLLAFSTSNNLKKILSYKRQDDGLDCIHGLKFSSICLIIMGHRIMFVLGSPIINSDFVESFYSKIEAMLLLNGPIVVDTFFNISGFLVSYLLLSEYRKRGKMINFLMLYIHRLIRLTPAYVVVLGFYCTLFVKIGSGPLWLEKVGIESERCVSSWWTNLLYINNYVNPEKMCMIQSWYLTCDMHLFMMAPFLVFLLYKKPTMGKVVLFGLILLSIIVSFSVTYFGKLDALLLLYMSTLRDPLANATFRNIYIPTHTRASPYLIGLGTGYLRYKLKHTNTKIPKILVWFGWIAAIVCIEGTIFTAWLFYVPGKPYDAFISATYGSFHRITWSMGISWMIIAMSTGNGAFIEPIFSWKPVITMSRLSYSAFLVHGGLQLYSVASARTPFYGSIYNLVWYSLGDVSLSFFGALGLTLAFESPILGLEKIIFGRAEREEETSKENIDNSFIENNNLPAHISKFSHMDEKDKM